MLNSFTCLIVDDEPNAIQLVTAFVNEFYKNIEIVGTYATWDTALEGINKHQADIIFMDISLPGKNGISILKQAANLKSEIIFVTAYEQYAIEAFGFRTSGYVLKPIAEDKFIEATDRALERIQLRKIASNNEMALKNAKIGIPNNKAIDYINISDILYFESINKSTRVVTRHTELISSYHIGKFKAAVDGHMFYQVHRSYIVNLDFISRYETAGATLVMSNKKEIPVSRSEKERFLKLFTIITRTDRY